MRKFVINLEKKVVDSANSGQFFKYVNKKLGRSHQIGILKNEHGEVAVTDEDKANCLNQFFSSVYVMTIA